MKKLTEEQRAELESAIIKAQDALAEAATHIMEMSITTETAAAVLGELRQALEELNPMVEMLEDITDD